MENGQRKKILYVITKSVWGGAQRYVFDLATNLPKDQFDVAVALGLQQENKYGLLETKLKDANISIYFIKNFQKSVNPFKDIYAFWELYKTCRQFQPNIIHTNSSKAGGITSASAFLYQLLSGNQILTIFTVHGWAFLEPRARWQLFLIRIASKLTASLHNKIIVVSTTDQTLSKVYNIAPSEKVILIHNGVNLDDFFSRDHAQQDLLGKTSNFLIGTIAERTKNKGLVFLLDAVPKIIKRVSAQFCLIGWHEKKEEKDVLREKIMKLELENVVFLASKYPAALYLKAFDIFVLPSLKEGLPYVLLEAGMAGLPVVATRVGGIPDIIENGKSGILVDPASPDQLADAVIKLSKDKNLREQMGQELQKRIKQDFSFASMLQKTIALYH